MSCVPLAAQRLPLWAWRFAAGQRLPQNLLPLLAAHGSKPFSPWRPLVPHSAEATRETRCTPPTQPSAWPFPPRRLAVPPSL